MNPYAGLNGLVPPNPATRLLQQPNAGMPNGLTIQGSLPMDDMKAVWMQNQAGLAAKAVNAGPNLGAMGLGGGAGQRMQQLPGGGLQGLQQVANGGMQQGGGLGGMRLDNASLAGMGLSGQNLQAMQQLQQAQAQAQAQAQQQQAAQQQAQALQIQQQLQQQRIQQQLQAQAQQQQQQQQAQLAQLRQQQQLQQLQQQHQLQQQLQQQQMANAGLQGNAGLMQGNLQSLAGANQQYLLNQGANNAASAQQLANNRQAELLAANGLNQMQLQGGAGQALAAQHQQLLQQQLLKQAAQQGVAASQGLQFGGSGVPPSTLLQQQLQANNAAQLRSLAQFNAAQQDLARRQHQAQLQAQQQAQQHAQAIQIQQHIRQQQLQQLQAAQAQQQQQQQQSANQQAINAAAMAALRANANANEREQLMRLMAAAAGKADTVGTLPSHLSTANATAALAQRQLVAGMNAQQKAAALHGLAAAAGQAGQMPPGGGSNAAVTQAMLSQLLGGNRPFEPNPARVGVIGQDRGKQPSTDLGGGLQMPGTAPMQMQSGTNPALSSLAGAVTGMGLPMGPGGPGSAGPSRQMTPPPVSSPCPGAAAAPGEAGGAGGGGGDAAPLMGSGLPLTASPENVEAFLKAVGKRFADMGLTIEQALEFNILKGLTKEQLAVLSESQNSASMAAAATAPTSLPQGFAGTSARAAGAAAGAEPAGLPSAPPLPSELLGTAGASAAAVAGAAVPSAAEDDDDDDKVLESLLEPEEKPAAGGVGQLDETAAAALLAMAQMDANFNAFTYGFFDDPTADTGGGLGDLLGELEPEGATTLEGDDAAALGVAAVSDLSQLADFDPIDPTQLASWGSIDTGAAEGAALAAALAAGALASESGDALLAGGAGAPGIAPIAEEEKPAGSEADGVSGQAGAEALTSDLKGLSLGAGFE